MRTHEIEGVPARDHADLTTFGKDVAENPTCSLQHLRKAGTSF
jgi:hypothetical protein